MTFFADPVIAREPLPEDVRSAASAAVGQGSAVGGIELAAVV